MTPRWRLAVHWHEADRRRDRSTYMVSFYEALWRDMGIGVEHVFGADRFVEADLAILHVDLSVVPREYLALARRYPRMLNGQVADIRKSSISTLRVSVADRDVGPVIVKSDLNSAGAPERHRKVNLVRSRGGMSRLLGPFVPRRKPAKQSEYRVYDCVADLPRGVFQDPDVIVERFVPEREGDLYAMRIFHFLGDQSSCRRLLSPEPVIRARSQIRGEDVDVHAEMETRRRELGFDFGKFDYVVHEGHALLLDANKTPGAPRNLVLTPERRKRWEGRARGLLSYLS